MGDEKVLAGVLDYAVAEFPAEKYSLFLWNHGGANIGVCSSEAYTAEDRTAVEHDILTPAKLESALVSSSLCRNEGKKYSLIGVDACLMGGVEIAYLFSPYCNYMIGSSELTRQDFNYGTYLSAVSKKTHTDAELADALVPQEDSSYQDGTSTRACYDLTKIQALVDKVNTASDRLNELSGDLGYILYDVVKNAKIHSMNYGEDGSRTEASSDGFEYVDIRSFFDNLSTQLGYWISAGQEDIAEGKDAPIFSAETLDKLIRARAAVDAVKKEQDYLQSYDVNYAGVNGGTSGSASEDYTQNLLSNVWGTDIRATSVYLLFFEYRAYQS
ncbi:MAG: clostripain-related cysteine peptidase [Lachnospiraceae bacterium]|jgi:hypothetical protein|nr:clostripain-related cysteine peptidase [Lachnospiraceae bacterium]